MRDIPVRKTALHQESSDRDYREMTGEERLAILWELTRDAWAFRGELIDESGFPRHVIRVVRRER